MAKASASAGNTTAADPAFRVLAGTEGQAEQALPPLNLTYEQALAELETLVTKMEAGQLPLDQLLTSYQRGAQLLQFCRGRLEAVEAQVKLLEAGQLKPLDAS